MDKPVDAVPDFNVGARDIWFDSWASQIGRSIADAVMFLFRGCVAQALSPENGPDLI